MCFVLSPDMSQKAHAAMKKISGTTTQLTQLLTEEIVFDQTRVRFRNNLGMFSSADPDWDTAKVFNAYFYINPTRQGDDYTGCFAITHPNGDQTFITYKGSWKWVVPMDGYRWTAETTGQFTGGTGKFQGIRGTFFSQGKGDGRKHLGSAWDIAYEVATDN
jgi:hypothetical protein